MILSNDMVEGEVPVTREDKKSLTEAIKIGLSDFWAPRLDSSYNEEKTGLVFKKGKMPSILLS